MVGVTPSPPNTHAPPPPARCPRAVQTIPQSWDNRATPGALSFYNGDFFTGTNPAQFPKKTTVGGVTAVVFNYSLDSVTDNVTTSITYFPLSSFYGDSDWSIDYWIYHTGYNNGGVNAVAQLGPRPGTTCDSLELNIGSHPTWGSLSFYSCDYPWASTNDNPVDTEVVPGSGPRPIPFKWHHGEAAVG